jgi:chromosome segregation ATPase
MQEEHNQLYQKYLDLEKSMGGSGFAIKELQQKEQNYIAEIKTLERHIDHLTHQLELAHKAMKELEEHRDKLEIEVNNHRTMNQNIENNQEGLQRLCSQLEQDKLFMQQQINDLKVEAGALEQQL